MLELTVEIGWLMVSPVLDVAGRQQETVEVWWSMVSRVLAAASRRQKMMYPRKSVESSLVLSGSLAGFHAWDKNDAE